MKTDCIRGQLDEIAQMRQAQNDYYDEICPKCGKPRGIPPETKCDGAHVWRIPIGRHNDITYR